ncbi:MAG TPA: ATP-binding protein [Candidatus Polarisedimenticolia bacterium]|nr:ATP-binding protein [Candidatus Polarisedimenticolia bacterium]
MLSAILLAYEAALFALIGVDLGRDFGLLHPGTRLLVAALALLPTGLLLWRPARQRLIRPVRRAAAVLGVATAALAILVASVEAGSRRMLLSWDEGAPSRLQARADILEADFAGFLQDIVRPFDDRLSDSADRRAAFTLLEHGLAASRLPVERYGLALYTAEGEAFAWAGNSTLAPAEIVSGAGSRDARFLMAGNEEAPRLYAARVDPFTGLTRVAEFLLRSPAMSRPGEPEAAARLEFLPHWGVIEPATIQALLARSNNEGLASLYAHSGDRHWWRIGRQHQLTLSVPLRAPEGEMLLTSNLPDRRAAQEMTARRAAARRLAALVAAGMLLLAAACLERRNPWPAGVRLLLLSLTLWGARGFLLVIAPDDALPPLPAYDIAVYSSSVAWGLFRSPLDLLLTAATAAAQAFVLRAALRFRGPRRPFYRLLCGIGAVLVAAGSAVALHRFLDRLVVQSRVDITRIEFDDGLAARLALQTGLFLLVLAAASVVHALGRAALGKAPPRPGATLAGEERRELPPPLRQAILIFGLTVLYVPLVTHAYDRLRRSFYEHDLLPRVIHQEEGRRAVLRDALAIVEQPEFVAAASLDEDPSTPGSLAYRLWSRTPLATMGLASSLRLVDDKGREISRFAVNLGEMFEKQFWEAKEAAGHDVLFSPPKEGLTIRKSTLYGARVVKVAHQPDRLVVLTVLDDYDNVPLLGAETAYLPLLRARAVSRTNPELMRFEPMLAVFGPSLERLYESGGEIPVPSVATLRTMGAQEWVWVNDEVGEGPASILYARGPDALYALAFARRDWAGLIAVCLRLGMLNGLLVLGGAGVTWLALLLAGRTRERRALGTSFYGRLTTVLLLTALAPMLALGWFVTRVSTRESERDLVAAGLTSLQTVRRVAEDYLNLPDQAYGPHLDNEVIFWLSRVVRQDINLYQGADLIASSTPELYGSSILNTRLDGAVYRALELDREPVRLARARVGDLEYLTLSAPMRIDPEGGRGVVSIPLAAQSRAVARKADELADAVLILTSVTVALLAFVGWQVARRVSGPIAALSSAARRVAAGDLQVRVRAEGQDEIGVLVEAFNTMAASLETQRQDLSRRREYIELILARATAGVLSLDARGVVITANPAAQQLLTPSGPAPGPGDFLPDHLARHPTLEPLSRALEKSLHGDLEGEVGLELGGADERRLRAVFLPFTPEQGALPGRIVILEDVTEIVRSGRLAAWAEMARRIAHEVKNPLTPIQLSVEHVRRLWLARDARFGVVLVECLDNIQGQVRKLRQMATEFSAYARLPQLRAEPTEVPVLLREALRPYLAAPPEGIDIDSAVPAGLPEVVVDRGVMNRVLVNLIENALQAMPEGGRLEVAAGREQDNGRSGVTITVRDTGTGMPPGVLARIFEPYFSTKSGGTGLGLAIARRAVEEHGGGIEIRSHPGAGTVVTLFLPARDSAAA